jgi:predicted metal-dependent phosphoesterase TrpH
MIDLHVHTNKSDGQFSPGDVVKRAVSNGVILLAITDHDTVDGLAEAKEEASRTGLSFIPGIEISVSGNNELHLLGYHIDPNNKDIIKMNEEFAVMRDEREERIYTWLAEKNVDITREILHKNLAARSVSRSHFARALISAGYARDFSEAFRKYLSTSEFYTLDRPKVSPEYGIEKIRNAGGVAVLAHPSSLNLDIGALGAMISKLVDVGLQGLECYYSAYNKQVTDLYIDLAKKYELVVTGGSDYHGEEVKPGIEIGTGINGSLSFNDPDIEEKLYNLSKH